MTKASSSSGGRGLNDAKGMGVARERSTAGVKEAENLDAVGHSALSATCLSFYSGRWACDTLLEHNWLPGESLQFLTVVTS